MRGHRRDGRPGSWRCRDGTVLARTWWTSRKFELFQVQCCVLINNRKRSNLHQKLPCRSTTQSGINLKYAHDDLTRSLLISLIPFQLSDDSDIEGHPNVDKRSLIRQATSPATSSTLSSPISDGNSAISTRNASSVNTR